MRFIVAIIAVILAIGSAYIYESARTHKSAPTGTSQPTAQTSVEPKPAVNWDMVGRDREHFTQPADPPAPTPIKAPEPAPSPAPPPAVPDTLLAPTAAAHPAERETPSAAPAQIPAQHPRGGWMIQIGAFADEGEAKKHLKAAQNKAPSLLSKADSFIERVVKGSREFYRARFAGLDKDSAKAACKYFKRKDIACMALKS